MPEPAPTQAKPKTKTKMAASRIKKASIMKKKRVIPYSHGFTIFT